MGCGSSSDSKQPPHKGKIACMEDVPVIDLEKYMGQDPESADAKEECRRVVESLHKYGILVVKDPRADQKDNSEYIDLMEKYFQSRGEILYAGNVVEDAKPQFHYQVGACPENLEMARNHKEKIATYAKENKPVSPLEPVFDAKWRFMWKIGERPLEAGDNFPQVIPSDFPDWEIKMDNWGHKLLDCGTTIAEMAALGFGLEKTALTERMDGAAHVLAPTGSDLQKNDVGAILAGFHYDISFLTIHGKSRFPGLDIWTREGQKLKVAVPDGCILMQAGKTFENITGGYVMAGLHEVIYTEETKAKYLKAKELGNSHWRVSSTMFSHLRYNVDCSPMKELSHLFDQDKALEKYGKYTALQILMEELQATNMVVQNEEDKE